MNKEFCIMPPSHLYKTERFSGSERHEVIYASFRKKAIKDGLVVFLTPEQHRGTNGVHGKNGKELNLTLRKIGQKAYMEYYNKTVEEFIKRYGRSYL